MGWIYKTVGVSTIGTFTLLVVALALPTAILAVPVWRRGDVPGARSLAVMLIGTSVWSFFYVGELLSRELEAKLLWASGEYFGAVVVPLAWLSFAISYTGRGNFLTRPKLTALSMLSLVTLLLVWTNDAHGLIWSQTGLDENGALSVTHGAAFWVYAALAYLYLAIGTSFLVWTLLRSAQPYRLQAPALLVAIGAPWLGNIIYLTNFGPFSRIDPTPFAFTITGLLIGWSLFRQRLLSVFVGLVPVAREAIFEGMPDGVLVLDTRGRILDLNPAAERVLGRASAEVIGQYADGMLGGPGTLGADSATTQMEIVKDDGASDRVYSLLVSPLTSRIGHLHGRLAVLRDITDRKDAEAELLKSERQYRSVVNTVSEVIFQIDASGRWQLLNPAWTRIMGYVPAESLRTYASSYVHPDDRAYNNEQFQSLIDGHNDSCRYEVRYRTIDGAIRWMQVHARQLIATDGSIAGTTGTLTDITDRKALEEQLTHQAFHDPLTSLANRVLFRERVSHALTRGERSSALQAVLFMDMDNFKNVNDSFGHAAGDELLMAVAGRLAACVRQSDTVARLGGDEFAILLEDLSDRGDADAVATHILSDLRTPFTIQGAETFVGVSIGIALSETNDGDTCIDTDTLLRNADIAMYAAKREGRRRAISFAADMHADAQERLALDADLHRALERGEFVIHYQPTIDLGTGRITGMEALVRWQHPTRGLISPLQFIPLAEESGLILSIGGWVLREACWQARRWQDRYPGTPKLTIAVNLSARQFQDPDLVDDVAAAIQETGLHPASLTLEITESVVMQNSDLTVTKLAALKALGVRLAVDDFGTGYSSLSYLQRFPIDILKIDKEFVSGVEQGEEQSALAQTIIQLAQTLRLQTVAEGIEANEQLERLRALGCDLGQGYYVAKPLDTGAVEALLQAERSLKMMVGVPDAAD